MKLWHEAVCRTDVYMYRLSAHNQGEDCLQMRMIRKCIPTRLAGLVATYQAPESCRVSHMIIPGEIRDCYGARN